MSLRSDILLLRDRSLADLTAGLDHFDLSRVLWSDLQQTGKPSSAPSGDSLLNATTGSQLLGPNLNAVVTAAVEVHLPSAAVANLVSVTEAFVFDLARLWILAHPRQLKGSVDVPTIVAATDIRALLEHLADRFVVELAYKSPRDWFRQLNAIVALGVPDDAHADAFAELKATRDVFVHNRGIANTAYVRKASALARVVEGKAVDLPTAYIYSSYRLCHAIVTDVGTAAAARA